MSGTALASLSKGDFSLICENSGNMAAAETAQLRYHAKRGGRTNRLRLPKPHGLTVSMKLPSHLVIFDTNIIEGFYLPHLLRGDPVTDLAPLRAAEPSYTPAICVKTLYEICGHLKSNRARKLSEFGHPGGIQVGADILAHSHSFRGVYEPEFRFQQIDELSYCDFDERLDLAKSLVRKSDLDKVRVDIESLAAFAQWKGKLSRFLDSVCRSIEHQFFIIERHHVYGMSPRDITEVMSLERDLAINSFVPSEDFEILVSALATDAAALVTNDKDLLHAGLSVSANHRTAFVAKSRLQDAVKSRFQFRLYKSQDESART